MLHVALLKLVVVASDVGIEREALRDVVDAQFAEEAEGFELRGDEFFERLKGFHTGVVGIGKVELPVVVIFPVGGVARGVTGSLGIAEGKVGQVVGHGHASGDAVEAKARDGEILVDHHLVGDVAQGVALGPRGEGAHGVAHFHVGVERIVARDNAFFGIGIVDRGREFELLGEELAGLHLCRDGILVEVVIAALAHGLFQSTEAIGLDVPTEVDGGQIGELDVELALCRPSALVGEVL